MLIYCNREFLSRLTLFIHYSGIHVDFHVKIAYSFITVLYFHFQDIDPAPDFPSSFWSCDNSNIERVGRPHWDDGEDNNIAKPGVKRKQKSRQRNNRTSAPVSNGTTYRPDISSRNLHRQLLQQFN